MNNPGAYTLAAAQITTALVGQTQTAIDDLDGMSAITLTAELAYGSGGTSASAVVQSTLDGVTWFDIARFDFTTASAKKWCVLQGLAAKAVTAYAALDAEGVNDGLLGTQLRAVLTTVGTYVNTVLSVRVSVR